MVDYSLEIFNNKHSYHLSCGEEAYFFPIMSVDGAPMRDASLGTLEWILRKDNEVEIARGSVDPTHYGEGCGGTLTEPGFLECEYILA